MSLGQVKSNQMGNVLPAALDGAEETLVVMPSREMLQEVVSSMDAREDLPRTHVLAEERVLKDVLDDFLLSSRAADLIDAERLTLQILEEEPVNSLVLSESSVTSLVAAGSTVTGLSTDDETFCADAWEYYDGLREDAETFSLRTPPLSRVRATLETDIGPQVAEDFDTVLESLETARGNGDGLDEVTISLLVAARNEELLYDISKWGEDIGLASKATFSRAKTQLEDKGLLDTEKVPIDVGRPRLRLMLGDERLAEADAEELASVAQSLITSG